MQPEKGPFKEYSSLVVIEASFSGSMLFPGVRITKYSVKMLYIGFRR